MVTGKDLIEWGFTPSAHFKASIKLANELIESGKSVDEVKIAINDSMPKPIQVIARQSPSNVQIHYNINAETDFEKDNLLKVEQHVNEIATIPTVAAISVMPDACPAGSSLGTIPVGGVVVTKNAIHPGMHSSDVCCSVAISVFDDADPKAILDAGMQLSHFGPGGRPYSHDMKLSDDFLAEIASNGFLSGQETIAQKFLGTQGDGNHFFYVGTLESTGQVALVTHHGSRKLGATLYKRGLDAAHEITQKISPEVSKWNSWLPFDSGVGQEYWEALQIIRKWTKKNHYAIHDTVAKFLNIKVKDRHWNEHNFVFKRDDYFFHAKGSTPGYQGFSSDTNGKTLIPLSMQDPILVTKINDDSNYGMDFKNIPSLGFSPHGAGRNFSRTQFGFYLKENNISAKDMISDLTSKFDIRAYTGKYDISEFPLAYKNAEQIIASINKFNLTTIVDKILPYGSIMAGHSGFVKRT